MIDFNLILSELLKISPFSVLLVLGFVLFYYMHKKAIEVIKDFSEKSIHEIRNAYHDAYNRRD